MTTKAKASKSKPPASKPPANVKATAAATKRAMAAKFKASKASARDGVKDMYGNAASNTGWGSSSQVNAGVYVPFRISLNYQELLAIYRGSWIARAVIDTIAEDMLKEWPTLNCEVTPDEIDKFERVVDNTMSLQKMVEGTKWGRLFGGALGLMIIEGDNDLSKPLDLDKVGLDSYRGLIIVDRWSGISPSSELVDDIDNPAEYGLPEFYDVTTETSQNFRVHHSRCLRFTGRELPLYERQIQSYWGMSELEPIFQEMQRRDFIESGIADLVSRAHVLVLKDELLGQMLSGVGMTQQQYTDYVMRMRAVSESISTNGILALSESQDLSTQTYTFSGLRDIHDSSMENIAGASGIPMSRLGRPIAGLGNTGDGELQVYGDSIEQKRNRELRPLFNKLLPVICMSTWGYVPDDLGYDFAPVQSMTAKDKADLAKTMSEPVFEALDRNIITDKTALEELKTQSGVTGILTVITDKQIAAADDELRDDDLPMIGEDGSEVTQGDALGGGKPQKKLGSGAKDAAPWWRPVQAWWQRLGEAGDGGM